MASAAQEQQHRRWANEIVSGNTVNGPQLIDRLGQFGANRLVAFTIPVATRNLDVPGILADSGINWGTAWGWVKTALQGLTGSGPGDPTDVACIFPKRRDPVTQQCRIFVGDQVGPDGGGTAVQGAFGMPAMVPDAMQRTRLSCPTGMVLGRDNLCYPKQVLRRDSKFRKWRPGMRPILTGGERRGIAKARRSVNRAREAVGLASLK